MYKLQRARFSQAVHQSVSAKLDSFVPKYRSAPPELIDRLREGILRAKRLVVLTGAGISTESGIPDYRSEDVGRFSRSKRRPVQYQEFINSQSVRQRFWARNYVGWPLFRAFQPNLTHHLIAKHPVHGLITQNVDHLHQKAGSPSVCELHGSNYRVICMNCQQLHDRQTIQDIIQELNPELVLESLELAPDGDVDIDDSVYEQFLEPPCPSCAKNELRPHVVFFGDNVPTEVKQTAKELVQECDVLLVLGSTLHTYSSFQHIRQAKEDNKAVYIVNIGDTRADQICDLKINAKCSEVLQKVL